MMKSVKKKFFCAMICAIFLLSSGAAAFAKTPMYNAPSVLVMDADTGIILYETDGFSRRYPASITKVMTVLLVLERVDNLDERVIFSQYALDTDYPSQLGISAGESISVREALYAAMLPSANEVTRALAEHVSGSVAEFVREMNQRAEELGAYNTRFVNPCGLPGEGQFVTAYDVALLMREAISHPVFNEIIATAYFELPPTEYHDSPREMRNTNLLVRPTAEQFDPRVIGGKTGFTRAAGHTLVSYAEYNGLRVIVTVLFNEQRMMNFSDTSALLDYVFREEAETVFAYNFAQEFVQEFAQEIEYEAAPPDEIAPTDYAPTEYTFEYVQPTDAEAAVAVIMSTAVGAAGLLLIKYFAKMKNRH